MSHRSSSVTPLPKRQVAVIAFAALAEPVCQYSSTSTNEVVLPYFFFSVLGVNFIFPFINEVIGHVQLQPSGSAC